MPIKKPEPTDDCVRPLLSSERTCRMSFLADAYKCWAALDGGGSGAVSAADAVSAEPGAAGEAGEEGAAGGCLPLAAGAVAAVAVVAVVAVVVVAAVAALAAAASVGAAGFAVVGAASAPAQAPVKAIDVASAVNFMKPLDLFYRQPQSAPSSTAAGVKGVIIWPSLAALVFR